MWWPSISVIFLLLARATGISAACLARGSNSSITVTGGSTSLSAPANWSSSVNVTGSSASAAWNVSQLTSLSGISLAPGSGAYLSCLTLQGAALAVPSAAAFGQPLALQASAATPALLQLSRVTIQSDCAAVRAHQQYLCSLNKVKLNGTVEVSSPYWLFVHFWVSSTVLLQDVNITCLPPAGAAAAAAAWPPCLVTSVLDGASMLGAIDRLQRQQGPPLSQPLPICVLLQQNVALTVNDVSVYWPTGLDITANVTIAGVACQNIVLDWNQLVNVLNVRGNLGSYLTLSNLIMINLPTSYSPPISATVHLFGILESTLTPVLRTVANTVTIESCTYVLPYDTFSYWAYWLSLAASSTPAISQLASWTKFQPLRITSNDPTRLRLSDTSSVASLWHNLTLASPDFHPVAINRTGLLEVSSVNGAQAYIPATAFFTVKSLSDMLYAINSTIGNFWTKQFGQTILLCANVSGIVTAAATNSTLFPSPHHVDVPAASVLPPPSTPAGGPYFDSGAFYHSALPPAPPPPPAVRVPIGNLSTGPVLQVPTTMTTWPGASVCWDLQQMHKMLVLTATAQLTIRGLSILNLPWSLSAPLATTDPIMRLVSGFWNLPQRQTNGSTSTSSFLTLFNVSLYVPPAELQLLFGAASIEQPDAPPDALSLSAGGHAIMARYMIQQEVETYDSGWIFYSTLVTVRFTATNVNISSSIPPACSDFGALPIPMNYSAFTTAPPAGGGGSSTASDSALPPWAIGLIAGLGGAAVLATALSATLVLRRRRRDAALAEMLTSASSKCKNALGKVVGVDSGISLGIVVIGQDAKCKEVIESFSRSGSGTFGPNMIDSADPPTVPLGRVDPQALIHRLTYQNTAMRDEQLQIFGVLGRGGHGIVYRGMWKGLPVAAKVMIVHEERHEQSKRQMLEATLSTSLSHANIVTTYSYDLKRLSTMTPNSMVFTTSSGSGGADGGQLSSNNGGSGSLDFVGATAWQLLIVQELCTGGTLREMVDGNNLARDKLHAGQVHDPNLEHVLQLALDVALGLEHLHSKNVVHSDMTPNNVLLQAVIEPRAAGLPWIAKLADFGLSVAFEEGKSHVSKMFAGTPYYIAPETQNEGIISKASDVFALGILLFEMVSGPMAVRKRPVGPLPALPPLAALKTQDSVAEMGGAGATSAGTGSPHTPPACAAAPAALLHTSTSHLAALTPDGSGGSGLLGLSFAAAPLSHQGSAVEYASQPLLGGSGGSYGAARILPQLPPACPPPYAALVADCLSPFPQRRPTISQVCQRLRHLAMDNVPGLVLASTNPSTSGSASGSGAYGSGCFDAAMEEGGLVRGASRRTGFAERAQPICEEETPSLSHPLSLT